ncbi:MAG: nucleoside triphosphate pyrophosphohydrolase [Deltaproteobacteria bacterium]|nr:nucleoside triphosphate pyrophosphohydrolase [Deltaproteobacteria bacterium]
MNRRFEPVQVPALSEQDGRAFARLVEAMRALLAPDGCPWDREQTYLTLRRYVLEEACEVIDAIDKNDRQALREELGDLLLQVVFQAELARAEGLFGPDDVVEGICNKLVRRHPHVFGDMQASDADEVHRNWERIKAEEKKRSGVLDGIPLSLPALVRAQRVGEKVHRVGFDWPDAAGSRAKVDEEIGELDRAIASNDPQSREEEFGDVLFALVNLARHIGVDAEAALRATTNKFVRRFGHVEQRAKDDHGALIGADGSRLPLEVLDRYWEEAKTQERGQGNPGSQ